MCSLDRGKIQQLLAELVALGEHEGLQIKLAVAGGAAIALLGGRNRTTKDVDVISLGPQDHGPLLKIVCEIAAERNLPSDWLNDGMKGYLQGLSLGKLVI